VKAFITSIVVALGMAVGAAWLLDATWQQPASDAFTTSGARVGDPGSNLVGGRG
jgi:hypothetical protein